MNDHIVIISIRIFGAVVMWAIELNSSFGLATKKVEDPNSAGLEGNSALEVGHMVVVGTPDMVAGPSWEADRSQVEVGTVDFGIQVAAGYILVEVD